MEQGFMPKIDPSMMKDIVCEQCGSQYFEQVTLMKRVSRLMTGEAKDRVIPIPVFRCADCGHLNKEFEPVARQ